MGVTPAAFGGISSAHFWRWPVRMSSLSTRSGPVAGALARADRLQREDKARLERYEATAAEYLRRFRELGLGERTLREAHRSELPAGRGMPAAAPCRRPGDMRLLSEDDLDLRDMTDEELERAWDLWFDLAQSTNDSDPPYTHGVFVNPAWHQIAGRRPSEAEPL